MLTTITAADRLPPLLRTLLSSPRIAFGGVLIFCSLLNLTIILPCYIASLLLTEVGLYISILTTIWCLGRWIVRLLTFPGSTYRVYNEIEVEFAKYSVRILDHCLDSTLELANALIRIGKNGTLTRSDLHELSTLTRKTLSYRNRVFAVYASVLSFTLDPESTRTNSLLLYGNNPLSPDSTCIDTPINVAPHALTHGKNLLSLLKTLLSHLQELEQHIGRKEGVQILSDQTQTLAKLVLATAKETKQYLPWLKPDNTPSSNTSNRLHPTNNKASPNADSGESPQEIGVTLKDRLSTFLSLILHHIDPPPHSSIFNLDVLRGCFLSRYKGSKQVWIPTSIAGRGMIDAIHIPAFPNINSTTTMIHPRAVVYCNPNAGLMELSTGMSFFGGNIVQGETGGEFHSWVDFYLENGFDVYLFNYRGYGRSYKRQPLLNSHRQSRASKILHAAYSSIFGFRPSPQSLKDDALTVCRYVIQRCKSCKALHNNDVDGVDVEADRRKLLLNEHCGVSIKDEGISKPSVTSRLIIHGESIGGMAAASAAKTLSTELYEGINSSEILLICDRTFCNLVAVARRMVGEWTRYLIPYLVPDWNTDVAADYKNAACRKIVAQDTKTDTIIHDTASLKSGLAIAYEMCNGETQPVGNLNIGSFGYNILEFENKGIVHLAPKPPVWPIDESFTFKQALHFAACIRRIHILASSSTMKCTVLDAEEHGIEIGNIHSPNKELRPMEEGDEINNIQMVWEKLSTYDGIAGPTLGVVAEHGMDWILLWICSLTVFGAPSIESTHTPNIPEQSNMSPRGKASSKVGIENVLMPLIEVIDELKIAHGDCSSREFQHELGYCIDSLEYAVARLSNPISRMAVQNTTAIERFRGCYLGLSCGHNNFYSVKEQVILSELIKNVFSPEL